MAVCVSGFLPQPVDGVEVFIRAHVRKRLVQEIHQVSSSVHLLCGRGTADTWQRAAHQQTGASVYSDTWFEGCRQMMLRRRLSSTYVTHDEHISQQACCFRCHHMWFNLKYRWWLCVFVLHKLLISITHLHLSEEGKHVISPPIWPPPPSDAAGRAQLAQLAQFIIADLLYLAEIIAGYKNNWGLRG